MSHLAIFFETLSRLGVIIVNPVMEADVTPVEILGLSEIDLSRY